MYPAIDVDPLDPYRRTAGVEFGNPDFVRLADAFGCRGFRVESAAQLAPILMSRAEDRPPPGMDRTPTPPGRASTGEPKIRIRLPTKTGASSAQSSEASTVEGTLLA